MKTLQTAKMYSLKDKLLGLENKRTTKVEKVVKPIISKAKK